MPTRLGLAAVAAVLLAAVAFNLAATSRPDFAAQIAHANKQPVVQRMPVLVQTRHQLEEWLAMHPSDSYGWQQLAYLRKVTQGSSAPLPPALGQTAAQQAGE